MTLKSENEIPGKNSDKTESGLKLDEIGGNVACDNNKDISNEKDLEFDELLSSAGEFGRYQALLFISTFPFYVFGVFVYYTQLFLTETSSNHWCWIPELENLTDIERRSLAIPSDYTNRYGYSHCETYSANWTEVLLTGIRPNNTWPREKCKYGWEFNKTEIPYPTISSELGWVCDKDSYQATAQSIFFVGSICGGFIIGSISDRFGRLPAAVVSNIFGCIFGAMSILSKNFLEFAIYRFFTGFAYDNALTMVFLLVLEYVAPKYRTFISNTAYAVFYAIAVTALPWIALACQHWKTLALVTSLPLALAIFAPLIMPESPRWLISRGRIDEAVNKILMIARINRKVVPAKLIDRFKATALKNKEESGSLLDLLRRPILRRMFICMCLLYSSSALIFDGLVRSIGQLRYDFFISFSIISLTEFPSVLLLAFTMDCMGRRWLSVISASLTCIFSILSVFVDVGIISVAFAVIARFCLNMTYSTSMQWCAEMLPVSVRGSGVAIIHVTGFVGYIIAPLIVYLETYVHWLPLVLIGIISGVSVILALMLPETAFKEMPQTFEDAENLVKNSDFWDVPCLRKFRKVSEKKSEEYVVETYTNHAVEDC